MPRMRILTAPEQEAFANSFTRAVAVGNPREFTQAEKEKQASAEACNDISAHMCAPARLRRCSFPERPARLVPLPKLIQRVLD